MGDVIPSLPSLEQASDPTWWARLMPGSSPAAAAEPAARLPDLGPYLDDLRVEGFLTIAGVWDEAVIGVVRACVLGAVAAGLPPLFAFVHEAPWRLFQSATPFLAAVLGSPPKVLPSFWAWCVSPRHDRAGWPPHRDRPHQVCLDPDGTPRSLSVWVPVTDATPENGCVYVVPMPLDHEGPDGRGGREGAPSGEGTDLHPLQAVRALPAPAGSLLAWNQRVLHWGGRAGRRASTPRISVACEFQSARFPPFVLPLRAPGVPSFEDRLGLIGLQLVQYQHATRTPELVALGAALRDRFLPT